MSKFLKTLVDAGREGVRGAMQQLAVSFQQQDAEGDAPAAAPAPRSRRVAAEPATEDTGRGGRRGPKKGSRRQRGRQPEAAKVQHDAPAPGSVLQAEHKGARHELLVTDGGFVMAGHLYPTLSAAGRAITGYPVNGWVFWGLKPAPTRKDAVKPAKVTVSMSSTMLDRVKGMAQAAGQSPEEFLAGLVAKATEEAAPAPVAAPVGGDGGSGAPGGSGDGIEATVQPDHSADPAPAQVDAAQDTTAEKKDPPGVQRRKSSRPAATAAA